MMLFEYLYDIIWENFKERYIIVPDENIVQQYRKYVMDYLRKLDKDFYSNDKKTFLFFSENDTKLLRTKFGFYGTGEIQLLKNLCKEFNTTCSKIDILLRKFNKFISIDMLWSIIDYIIPIERFGETSICKLGLADSELNLLMGKGFMTIQDITKLTIEQAFLDYGISRKIVNHICSLGYKFADENVNSFENKSIDDDTSILLLRKKVCNFERELYKYNSALADLSECEAEIRRLLSVAENEVFKYNAALDDLLKRKRHIKFLMDRVASKLTACHNEVAIIEEKGTNNLNKGNK